jgi:hypothetical protein
VHTATLTLSFTAAGSSTVSTATTTATFVVRETSPSGIGVDYINEQLTGFAAGAAYILNGTPATADAQGRIAIDEAWMSGVPNGLQVVKANATNAALNSAALAVTVASRPAKPSAEAVPESLAGRGDGKIVNASTAMEFSSNGGLTWMFCNGPIVDLLQAGAYLLRVKATPYSFKSVAQGLTILTGGVPQYILTATTPSFASQVYGYSQPAPMPVNVFNSGNDTATISVSSSDNSKFTIIDGDSAVASGSKNATWKVQPVAGLVVGEHTAVITAAVAGGSVLASAPVSFTVRKAEQAPLYILEGSQITVETTPFTVTLHTGGGSGTGAKTWTCSDTSVIKVDANGVIIALAEGSAIITVVQQGDNNYSASKPATIKVMVLPAGTIIPIVNFTATANGDTNKFTSQHITLTFAEVHPGLNEDSITLMGATMTESIDSISPTVYILDVHSVADEVATVIVRNNARPVKMHVGPTLLSAKANGTANLITSTELTLEFDKPIVGIAPADITFTPQGGNAQVASVSSQNGGKTWVAQLSNVQQGPVDVHVAPPTNYSIDDSTALDVLLNEDLTEPTVLRTSPQNGDVNVAQYPPLFGIMFSELMSSSAGAVSLVPNGGGSPIALTFGTWMDNYTTATFTNSQPLEKNTTYTFQISGFTDSAGNPLIPITTDISFTTEREYKATITPADSFVFETREYGSYGLFAPQIFTLTNTGFGDYGSLEVHLADGTNFAITRFFDSDVLLVDSLMKLSARPDSGLPASATPYTDALIITGDHGLMLTVKLVFRVAKKTFSRPLLKYNLPDTATYDGLPKPVSVGLAANVLGAGAITVLYNGSDVAPIAVGSYTISVNVAEGEYYRDTSNMLLNGQLVIIPQRDTTQYLAIIAFGDYAKRKWNNVLMLNVNRLIAENYTVRSCRWYEGGALLGNSFAYSKGDRVSDKLVIGATYYFVVEVEGGTLLSTDTIFLEPQPSLLSALHAYPNPVVGGELKIENEELKAGDKIELYSINGRLLKAFVAAGQSTTISVAQLPAGTYIVKVNGRQVKVVAK